MTERLKLEHGFIKTLTHSDWGRTGAIALVFTFFSFLIGWILFASLVTIDLIFLSSTDWVINAKICFIIFLIMSLLLSILTIVTEFLDRNRFESIADYLFARKAFIVPLQGNCNENILERWIEENPDKKARLLKRRNEVAFKREDDAVYFVLQMVDSET